MILLGGAPEMPALHCFSILEHIPRAGNAHLRDHMLPWFCPWWLRKRAFAVWPASLRPHPVAEWAERPKDPEPGVEGHGRTNASTKELPRQRATTKTSLTSLAGLRLALRQILSGSCNALRTSGGGGGNRTREWKFCKLLPYHLATPPFVKRGRDYHGGQVCQTRSR